MDGKDRLFLINGPTVQFLITKADLQKPPVRMLFFGLVTLLESEMAEIIRIYHPKDKWKNLLSEGRLEKVEALFENRMEKNMEIDLLDCTQFADKKTIILSDPILRSHLLDVSKNLAESWLRKVESLRNDLAHAQSLAKWFETEKVISLVGQIQEVIQKMEILIFDKINRY